MKIVKVDLQIKEHEQAFIKLMNAYMKHPMGKSASITADLANEIIRGLIEHPTYIGVMVKKDYQYVGLANCFKNYSTFNAKPLINIHDFIVLTENRKSGVGQFLLNGVWNIGKQLGCCRVNLEVRYDNDAAMNLYKKVGYNECNPPMYFWEKPIT